MQHRLVRLPGMRLPIAPDLKQLGQAPEVQHAALTCAPAWDAAASSMERLASRICPGPSFCVAGSTTSSPVDMTATCTCRCTCSAAEVPVRSVLQWPAASYPLWGVQLWWPAVQQWHGDTKGQQA